MQQQNSSKKFNLKTEIFTTKVIQNWTNVTNDILDLKLKCVTEGNLEDLNKWRHLSWSWVGTLTTHRCCFSLLTSAECSTILSTSPKIKSINFLN